MTAKTKNKLDRIIVVGDRVLIKLKSLDEKTRGGLYLPPGVKRKENIQSGYIIKVGPGYPLPSTSENRDEAWKQSDPQTNYLPLQAQEGDLALFMMNNAHEIDYDGVTYHIVPQNAILLLERDEGLFKPTP